MQAGLFRGFVFLFKRRYSLLLKAHPYLRYEQICIDPTSGNDGIFL